MSSVEVLFFAGCPHAGLATERARMVAAATGMEVDVRLVPLDSHEDATRLRFLGSPTIRVDGVDVEASARVRTDFGLQCRVYLVDGRLEGAPPVEWIADALGGRSRT